MKTIRILKFHQPLGPNKQKLDAAARAMSERTGFHIVPIADGFTVAGVWQGKFENEEALAWRISRDLQLASGVIFDSTVEE